MVRKKKKDAFLRLYLDQGKIPPQAVELEEQVLGVIISFPKLIAKIKHLLNPEMFYKESNQLICEHILILYKENEIFDLPILTNFLRKHEQLDVIGGPYYLTQLVGNMYAPTSVEFNLMIIYQMYALRQLIKISSETSHEAYEQGSDPFEIIKIVQGQLEELYDLNTKNTTVTTKQSIYKTFEDIMLRGEGNIKSFYETGNKEFDRILTLSPENIILVAGTSGSGKTKWVTALIRNLLDIHSNISILWYAMEDPHDKLMRCFISQNTLLTDQELLSKNIKLTRDHLHMIMATKKMFDSYDIEFVNKPETIDNIHDHFVSFCKKKPKKNLKILIIDNYMKLRDNISARKNKNEVDEYVAGKMADIESNTRKHQSLIFVLHHMTKEQKGTLNLKEAYRPDESHVRGSTRIIDNCTQVVLINRPGMFDKLKVDMLQYREILEYLFITEVTKNRNGTLGIIRWWTHMGYNIFKEINS